MNHPDRVMADLRREELRQDRLEREQAAIEVAAEPVFLHIMKNLDSDILDGAFGQFLMDEYKSMEEDFGHSDMRDPHHGGTIVSNAIERYVMALAIKEVMGD